MESERRSANVDVVKQIFSHLESGNISALGALTTADVSMSLPFQVPGWPASTQGRAELLDFLSATPKILDSLRISLTDIHQLVEPDLLIVEYRSDAVARNTGRPYQNRYIAIFTFAGGQVSEWKEFFNPIILQSSLAG
jgi:ketosteroid isomerase-like protein